MSLVAPQKALPFSSRGICFVISAPSGAGKSTIANALRASQANLHNSISVTTRKPRPGEVDGIHYYFLTQEKFEQQAAEGALLEWAMVFGRGYGTPRAPVESNLAAGKDMIFDIDWQGHRQIRKALPNDVVSIFILPPSLQELERRLTARAADKPEEIAKRMAAAKDEISHWHEFDYIVVNNRLDGAIQEVESILRTERLRISRQNGLEQFIAGFES